MREVLVADDIGRLSEDWGAGSWTNLGAGSGVEGWSLVCVEVFLGGIGQHDGWGVGG